MANCKAFFGQDDNFFAERSCINTASEIAVQSEIWGDLAKLLLEKKQSIRAFMEGLQSKPGLQVKSGMRSWRIILSGAGSSAFIGEALSGFAAKSSNLKCEAIHTTDIVSAPETYLFEDIPTLLISFARSGNSPESLGAVQYAREKIKNLREVAIICDGTSRLYELSAASKNNLTLVMPDGSNDKGFAMTASFTCMLLAGFALLNCEKIDEIVKDIYQLSENLAKNSLYLSDLAQKYAKIPFDRAVYLASGAFKGLAHEGSLKMMELSGGEVNTSFDSATGFRHGPKSVIKDKTISLHFISSDPFSARYDVDLLNEVLREKKKNTVVAICPGDAAGADDKIKIDPSGYGFAADLCTGISGLVFFQMLAMYKSLELRITTDNPSPGGQVNRVVKGVTVYPLG